MTTSSMELIFLFWRFVVRKIDCLQNSYLGFQISSLGSVAILIGFAIVNLPEPKMFAWDNIKRKFSAQDTTEWIGSVWQILENISRGNDEDLKTWSKTSSIDYSQLESDGFPFIDFELWLAGTKEKERDRFHHATYSSILEDRCVPKSTKYFFHL